MRAPGARWTVLLALLALLAASSAAVAAPEPGQALVLEDPEGDAVHLEERHQEPSLDGLRLWIGWEGEGVLLFTLEIRNLTTPGPAGTQDPIDDRTYVDVYWDTEDTTDGDPHVARFRVEPDGERVFEEGRAMVIDRSLAWAPDPASPGIHGTTEPVTGHVVTEAPGTVTVRVPAHRVGSPVPGDVLRNVTFSTYVDHHQGTPDEDLHHHPGHVDSADELVEAFTLPAVPDEGGDGQGSPDGEPGGSDVPAVGAASVAVAAGLVAVGLRRVRRSS